MIQEISDTIYGSLDEIIAESEKSSGIPLDPSYEEFIKSDIARQLRHRIEMYLNNTSHAERTAGQHESLKEKISERIKTDIRLAVDNFIAYSQKQTGGQENDGV